MELPSPTPSPSVVNIAETSLDVSVSEQVTVYNSISPTTTAVLTTDTAMLSTTAIIGIVVPAAIIIIVFAIITIVIISFVVLKHKRTKLAHLDTLYWRKSENNYMDRNEFTPDGAEESTILSIIASDSTAVDNHDPTYMEARSEFISTRQEPTKPQEPVYADLQHSTNPPAPPLPVPPTQYATVQKQTENPETTQSEENKEDSQLADRSTNPPAPPPPVETVPAPGPSQQKPKEPVYADLHHSTNPPAPPLPVEPVQYTTIREQTDNTISTQSEENKEDFLDADHSTNPPAPLPAVEPGGTPGRPSQQEPVYADLPHSTTGRPAPPPPVEQTDNAETTQSKELQYAQVQHCITGRPAPPLPVEPVQYATVKPQTDHTVTTQPEDNTGPVQYGDNSNNKHPRSCEGSSSGYHSASALSVDHVDMPTMASESTGPDKPVFLQSKPYRPDNSKCADAGLLYSDTEDASGQVSWSAIRSMEVTSNHSSNQHVVPTVSANTTPVVETTTRGGGLPSDNGDSQTGSVQQFQCQLDASNDDISVEELCLSEDEGTLLSASIATSEHTSLGMEFRSRMEQDDSLVVQAGQMLVTAEKPAEINNEEHEVVFGWTKPKDEEDMWSTVSQSLFNTPSNMEEKASVSKQPHEQWVYVTALPQHYISTTDVLDSWYCRAINDELICSSSYDNHDDDTLQPTYTLASKVSVIVSGCSGAGKIALVRKLVETAKVNDSAAHVLVSYPVEMSCQTALLKCHSSWSVKIAEDGWYLNSDNSEFVPLRVFQQNMKDEKYANKKQLAVFTAPQNIESLLETEFFTHVVLDEEAHELQEALMKMANNMDELANFDYVPEEVAHMKNDDPLDPFSNGFSSLIDFYQPVSCSSSFPHSDESHTAVLRNESLAIDETPVIECTAVAANNSAQNETTTSNSTIASLEADAKPTLWTAWRNSNNTNWKTLPKINATEATTTLSLSAPRPSILVVTEKLQSLKQFIESTTVLEFRQAVSSTAEFAIPEGKECIKIEVSKKWARVNALKDVISLAQRVFGDNYKSFISFNVVARMGSIFITWLFPKRLKVELQGLVSTRRTVFRQENVHKVKFGDFTAFTHESEPFVCVHHCFKPDRKVSVSQWCGFTHSSYSYCTPSLPLCSPSLRELVEVCKNVDDWYKLGMHMRLSVKQLDHIHRNYSHLGTEAMKRMMFDVWLKITPGASWTDLITALREIGEEFVACMIEVHKISAIRPFYWGYSFSFEDDVQYFINEETSFLCTVLFLLKTIGSCQKVTCRVRHCRLSHGVLKVAYYKWPFKDEGTADENTQSKNCSHDMCSSYEVVPINGNASRSFTLLQQRNYASSLVQIWKGLKDEYKETGNRKVTQLNAPLDTTEEYSAEEDNDGFYIDDNLSSNLFKNTNKSDVPYTAGKAILIGAASLIRDMESQFARFTETQSSISGVISAMWSYSMIPTVNSFTYQLAGGGLVQLIC